MAPSTLTTGGPPRLRAATAAYVRHLRAFSRNGRLLLVSTLFGALSAGVFGVAYNLYVLELGFTAGAAGRLITAGGLAAGLAAIPAGLLAIRIGAKPVILLGGLLLGSGAVFQVLPFGYGYLVAGAALGGLGGALWAVVISPLFAASTGDAGRSYLFTTSAIVFLGMSFAGSVLGGWAPRALGQALGVVPWVGFFLVLGGASLVGGLGFFPLLALDGRGVKIDTSIFSLLRREWRPTVKILAVHVTIAAGAGLTIPFLNIYFTRQLGFSEAQFGVLAGAGVLTRLGATVVAPALAERLGKTPAIVLAQTASVPALLALAVLPWPLGSTAAFLTRGAFMNMTAPLRSALYMEAVSSAARPAASAALLVGWNLVWAGSAAIGGELADGGRLLPAALGTSALYLLANGILWATLRNRTPDS